MFNRKLTRMPRPKNYLNVWPQRLDITDSVICRVGQTQGTGPSSLRPKLATHMRFFKGAWQFLALSFLFFISSLVTLSPNSPSLRCRDRQLLSVANLGIFMDWTVGRRCLLTSTRSRASKWWGHRAWCSKTQGGPVIKANGLERVQFW